MGRTLRVQKQFPENVDVGVIGKSRDAPPTGTDKVSLLRERS